MVSTGRLLASVAAWILASATGTAAAAPQAENEPARASSGGSESSVEEVLVTGSRGRRDGFDAPNPLTVVTAEQIERLAQINVAETLSVIPQNTAFQSDTNIGIVATVNVGATTERAP